MQRVFGALIVIIWRRIPYEESNVNVLSPCLPWPPFLWRTKKNWTSILWYKSFSLFFVLFYFVFVIVYVFFSLYRALGQYHEIKFKKIKSPLFNYLLLIIIEAKNHKNYTTYNWTWKFKRMEWFSFEKPCDDIKKFKWKHL